MGRVNFCRAEYVFILLLSWIFFQPAGLLAYVMDKGLPFMKSASSVGTFINKWWWWAWCAVPYLDMCWDGLGGGVAELFADWYKHWRRSVHADLFPLLQCNLFLAVQSVGFFLSNMENDFFPFFFFKRCQVTTGIKLIQILAAMGLRSHPFHTLWKL